MWAGHRRGGPGRAPGKGRLTDISHAVENVGPQGAAGTASSTATAATASAPRCTRTRTCSTTAGPGRGPRLVPGMALAIEPMITLGSPRTVELADGWTVVTRDGSVAAHVEHTVALARRRGLGAHRRGRRRRPGSADLVHRWRAVPVRTAPERLPSGPDAPAWPRPALTAGPWRAVACLLAWRARRDAGGRRGPAAVADRLRMASTRAGSTCTSTTSGAAGVRRADVRRAGRAADRPAGVGRPAARRSQRRPPRHRPGPSAADRPEPSATARWLAEVWLRTCGRSRSWWPSGRRPRSSPPTCSTSGRPGWPGRGARRPGAHGRRLTVRGAAAVGGDRIGGVTPAREAGAKRERAGCRRRGHEQRALRPQ